MAEVLLYTVLGISENNNIIIFQNRNRTVRFGEREYVFMSGTCFIFETKVSIGIGHSDFWKST